MRSVAPPHSLALQVFGVLGEFGLPTSQREEPRLVPAKDKLGRLILATNPLGTFNRSYLGYTDQLSSSLLSGSTIGTTYHYLCKCKRPSSDGHR